MLAAARKFLRFGELKTKEEELDLLYPLARRIRQAEKESDLSEIENQIDEAPRAQRARAATGEEAALDTVFPALAFKHAAGARRPHRGAGERGA